MRIDISKNTFRNYTNVTDCSSEDKTKIGSQDMFEQIKKAVDQSRFKNEQEKKEYEDKLNTKIKYGKELSVSDMEYIRETNPTMYMHVMRAQLQREMTAKQLEDCKSKKEVRNVQLSQLVSIDDKDPDKEIITAAVNDAVSEYKKTEEYKALPEEIKKEKDNTKPTQCDMYQYKESIVYAMITEAKFDIEA